MLRDLKRTRIAGAMLAVSLLATACGGGTDTDTESTDTGSTDGAAEGGDLSGSIAVSGSSTVEPISALNAELFAEQNPGVAISVEGPGTGDGFEKFCAGETDISDASRPIKDEEAEACAAAGIEYTELKVAIDGLSILTNPANDAVECLDFAALYALTGPESNGFATWSDASALASELGSSSTLPDAPLTVTGPGEESGTYDTYVELVIEEFNEDRGADAATRSDYQASANDNVIVQGITGDETALGWVGYAFFVENSDALKALAVDGGDGCVEPTDETLASGEYPLARDLYIYVNNAKADEKPELQAFVDFYLSEDGIASVSEVGYVQLAEADLEATRAAWSGR
ncbi:MAG: phosphate ABC transporter substrate-binding protein PstS family protein [Actinomycetes bacterium]